MSDIQSIKYRVVGALVIVVSLLLAWWILLDHDIQRYKNVSEDIPEAVVIERFEIKPVGEFENVADDYAIAAQSAETTDAAEISVSQTQEKNVEPKDKPLAKASAVAKPPVAETVTKKTLSQQDERGLPEAWVLQVASFSERENAQQLQEKLYKADFPAYVKTFTVKDAKVYRVLIGPKLSKSRAHTMAKQVEKQFNLKTLLVAFKPGYEE
jgi:DedD protein